MHEMMFNNDLINSMHTIENTINFVHAINKLKTCLKAWFPV